MSTVKNKLQVIAEVSNGLVDLVEEIAQVTVLVNARKRYPVSGILINPNQILTVDHGVEKEEGIEILGANPGVLTGKLVGRDPGTDLALLTLDREVGGLRSMEVVAAKVGMPVVMIGRPEPDGHQASFGMVTTVGSNLRTARGSVLDHYIASDATSYPGFSGGPLAGLNGHILGINTSGLVGGLSLAIPLGLALHVAKQLSDFGRVKRGFLGIRSQRVELSAQIRNQVPDSPKSGLLIVGLEDNGPAAAAGLLIGDILVSGGEYPLSDQDELMTYLSSDKVGKTDRFQIVRGGELKSVDVQVGMR